MSEKKPKDLDGMIIGGSTLMGLGVGFLLLESSALYFTASLLIGVGFGLFMTVILNKKS